jgi:hypothetical protein
MIEKPIGAWIQINGAFKAPLSNSIELLEQDKTRNEKTTRFEYDTVPKFFTGKATTRPKPGEKKKSRI